MRKLKILVDMDGIITDTFPVWLEDINARYGVNAKMEGMTCWKFTSCYPLNQLNTQELLAMFNEPGFALKLRPLPGALEVLKKLHDEGHEVHIVTARFGEVGMPETIRWIRSHMPWFDVEHRLAFMFSKHMLKADVLIDDRAETLHNFKAENPDAELITIRYPYNERDIPAEAFVVDSNEHSWASILLHMEDLVNREGA